MRIAISCLLLFFALSNAGCSKKKKKEEKPKPSSEHVEKRRMTRGDVQNHVPNRPLVRRTRPYHHPRHVRNGVNPYRRRYADTNNRLKHAPRPGTLGADRKVAPRPTHLAPYRGPRLANKPPRSPYRRKYRRFGQYRHSKAPNPSVTKHTTPPEPAPKNEPPEPTRVGPPLSLEKMITDKELVTIVGKRARFRRRSLMGQEVGPGYNALYFQPVSGKAFGVAIQVWKSLSKASARRKFAAMKRSFPNVENVTDLPDKAFLSVRNELVFLTVSLPTVQAVISVACSRSLCPSFDILMGIAKTVRIRALANL
ncbi:MAG: hypothetical protein KC609_05345 [Myxococcales bacterium]|nr:hypothetical protein [Myxococcales bacterium]